MARVDTHGKEINGEKHMLCSQCGSLILRGATESQLLEIIKLRKEGYSIRDIQEITGVSTSTIHRLIKKQLTGKKAS